MGRGQGRARAIAAAAALLLGGAASPSDLPIREARWLKTSDLAADLVHQPAECHQPYNDPVLERSAKVGAMAFRAPLLLGGQAARAGLSCSSCHRNGRTNSDFHFPGISGQPGTADVTASLMSSHRGDGIFNPKPIPDLAGDPAKLKVSRDPSKDDLKRFIHGLVTQEFDGPEPPPAVLDGLTVYVRSLSRTACKGPSLVDVTLEQALENVETAVALARESFAAGDAATARFLISAARSTLGAIDERFQAGTEDASRAILKSADADLRSIALADHVSNAMFDKWQERWPARSRALRSAEPRSLYSEAVIRKLMN